MYSTNVEKIIGILNFYKISIKNSRCKKNVLHQHEKILTSNTPCFGLKKKDKIWHHLNVAEFCQIFLFLLSQEYKVFRVEIL